MDFEFVGFIWSENAVRNEASFINLKIFLFFSKFKKKIDWQLLFYKVFYTGKMKCNTVQ